MQADEAAPTAPCVLQILLGQLVAVDHVLLPGKAPALLQQPLQRDWQGLKGWQVFPAAELGGKGVGSKAENVSGYVRALGYVLTRAITQSDRNADSWMCSSNPSSVIGKDSKVGRFSLQARQISGHEFWTQLPALTRESCWIMTYGHGRDADSVLCSNPSSMVSIGMGV